MPTLDWLLILLLGFLGSFGHCVGMCGPLSLILTLKQAQSRPQFWQQLQFHGWLNLGRLISYTLVGAGIGGVGSVLIAAGQLAGLDSWVRRGLAIGTGSLLIWLGLVQLWPQFLPRLPLAHPFARIHWHERLGRSMAHLAASLHWWTPFGLGLLWGMMPCGFLYIAQIKAAETGNPGAGALTMLAFGLGTVPVMVGVGLFASRLTQAQRHQLFQLGGWMTLLTGLLILFRTGVMVEYTGYAALLCLMLALVARPLGRLLPSLLRYRRALGVAAFGLAIAHTGAMLDHTFEWNLAGLPFLLPIQQGGIWAGFLALGCLLPPTLTSFDGAMQRLGSLWRLLHLLVLPALLLAVVHVIGTDSHYLGTPTWTASGCALTLGLGGMTLGILLIRTARCWSVVGCRHLYRPAIAPHNNPEVTGQP